MPQVPVPSTFPVIRGRVIRVDADGLVCLNDIWQAAGFSKFQKPNDWRRLEVTTRLTVAVLQRITGKNRNWSKSDFRTAIYAKTGPSGGTYADVRLALAYAEYLNPTLALEVREVFLRYKAADPTLADDILERAGPEANEWAGTRALSRSVRNQYTNTLRDHGAKGQDYGMCTNTLYSVLFDRNAKQLRSKKGVPAKSNLRDAMNTSELVFVMAGETLSAERIIEERSSGGEECRVATSRSARFIRQAIDADRKDRRGSQPELL
ncbi:MAG TPA: KilA-N domain-containing protein [Caulobacteraceae bacterium]|jgi:hypothetical protein|nr:KilA-N domain-containing protein [Caulobacteraceae bacterium]